MFSVLFYLQSAGRGDQSRRRGAFGVDEVREQEKKEGKKEAYAR